MVYNGRLRMVYRNSHGRTVKWVQPLGKIIGQLLDKGPVKSKDLEARLFRLKSLIHTY